MPSQPEEVRIIRNIYLHNTAEASLTNNSAFLRNLENWLMDNTDTHYIAICFDMILIINAPVVQ